ADGGHVALRPAGEFTTSRRYVEDTNVLETTFHTDTGTVRVTDALSIGLNGLLPWEELVRKVDGVDGEVEIRWAVTPGDRLRTVQPWVEARDDSALVHIGDQHLAVRCFDLGTPDVEPHRVSGTVTVKAGDAGLLALTASDASPVMLARPAELAEHVDLTVTRWREWSRNLRYDGEWRDAVIRSALALKLLAFTPTGAIAAAPTTSLPERIGGDRNWDYRFMWVRDASFSLDAFISLGMLEETHAAVVWLLESLQQTEPDLHVFYRLNGQVPGAEEAVDLPGYRGSQPVRSGNGAAGQTQLGVYGDLFATIWRYVDDGHALNPAASRLLCDLADRCCDEWTHPDAGIWELDESRHYTISKMGCWSALDCAARLHERGEITTGHVDRWKAERDAIKRWVTEHCWSEAKQAYSFYAGTDELDAATLLAARNGFDTGKRLRLTIDAVRRELAHGPLLYRYTGMETAEGAFLACTFWLVSALVVTGQLDDARALMSDAVELANDVGLYAEELDPGSGEMLGNFPQGLTHLALVNAAVDLHRAAQEK
ncbi:MAG TPA: glycoside hydrolase family 15 protein, partial [Mycobacteriales bacterium]|nr:glycoside hydrolase family 15 protein [Mycobacteriales bacterium]